MSPAESVPIQHPPNTPRTRRVGTALLPWLVGLGILGWLFYSIPIEQLRSQLGRIPVVRFVVFVFFFTVANLAADSAATWATLRRSIPEIPLGFVEALKIRGASYLIAILNYAIGQGGVLYLLRQRHGVPVPRAAGALMLTLGVNAVLIAACASIGLLVGGAPKAQLLRMVVASLGLGLPLYLAVVRLRPRVLASLQLLKPLFDAGLRGHLIVALARLPHLSVLLVGHFVAMRFFGVNPPFPQAMTLLPLVFLAGVLPISPSGLGTAQAVAVSVFSGFVDGKLEDGRAAVLAYSLSLHFVALACQAVIGLACLPTVGGTRIIRQGNGLK